MAPATSLKNLSEILAEVPSGAWVALSQDGSRVLAYAAEMQEVIEEARKQGEERPLITRVPQAKAAALVL